MKANIRTEFICEYENHLVIITYIDGKYLRLFTISPDGDVL